MTALQQVVIYEDFIIVVVRFQNILHVEIFCLTGLSDYEDDGTDDNYVTCTINICSYMICPS